MNESEKVFYATQYVIINAINRLCQIHSSVQNDNLTNARVLIMDIGNDLKSLARLMGSLEEYDDYADELPSSESSESTEDTSTSERQYGAPREGLYNPSARNWAGEIIRKTRESTSTSSTSESTLSSSVSSSSSDSSSSSRTDSSYHEHSSDDSYYIDEDGNRVPRYYLEKEEI